LIADNDSHSVVPVFLCTTPAYVIRLLLSRSLSCRRERETIDQERSLAPDSDNASTDLKAVECS
jgi:hypothetical protein